MGAVQDNYILGSGDELQITFTGQRTDSGVYTIDSAGMLLITDFPPIPAAGREIAQVRLSIAAAAANLHNTQAFVSLSRVRQIGVLVVGRVAQPGLQRLSVFHTVLDALAAGGGVTKDGSLRGIKMVRSGRSVDIDLYDLLIAQSAYTDLTLRDGDRLMVPPVGPTVAISGAVKRPGIYELRKTAEGRIEQISLDAMLELAGGLIAPGQNRFMKMSPTPDGREIVAEVTNRTLPQFGDGAILSVQKGQEKRAGTVELAGHTRRPGLHDLAKNNTLSRLLDSDQALGPDIYPLIGVIERYDPALLAKKYFAFPMRLVLKKEYDQRLEDGDIVHLFSNADIASLAQEDGAQADTVPVSLGSPSLEKRDDSLPPVLRAYLLENGVYLRGAVRKPGLYPVSGGETLDGLLAAAGGLPREADPNNIEITSSLASQRRGGMTRQNVDIHAAAASAIAIGPGDTVRVNRKFAPVADSSVLISGEVLNPGRYDLLPGDKVSDLLRRAGGMTEQAYPPGAIFSRESERRAEEKRFRSAAQDMERSLAAAIRREDEPPDAAQIEMVRGLAAELAQIEAIGRITVEADPAVLAVEPDLDMLLEAGDRLYIPQRPLTVRVSGEVLSPASLQFRTGKDPLDYIREAGGFTYHADKDRTFVLYPNGSAQPLLVNVWNHKPAMIPPGSTIVVPRDPKPFDFIQSARDLSQILSNLAVTGIFIDDLKD